MHTGLTAADLEAAIERMQGHELEFLQRLTLDGTPGEARVLIELFHYFPGIRILVEESPSAPENDELIQTDELETQTRLDVWEEQEERRQPIDPAKMPIPF